MFFFYIKKKNICFLYYCGRKRFWGFKRRMTDCYSLSWAVGWCKMNLQFFFFRCLFDLLFKSQTRYKILFQKFAFFTTFYIRILKRMQNEVFFFIHVQRILKTNFCSTLIHTRSQRIYSLSYAMGGCNMLKYTYISTKEYVDVYENFIHAQSTTYNIVLIYIRMRDSWPFSRRVVVSLLRRFKYLKLNISSYTYISVLMCVYIRIST